MSFLLDTDTCSAHLKSNSLSHRFLQHLGRLHISAVTLAELYAWVLRVGAPRRRIDGLNDLLRDVAVLDVAMPGMTGIDILSNLVAHASETKVIFLTAGVSDKQLLTAIAQGARGLILKDVAADNIVKCVREVAEGRLVADHAAIGRWPDHRAAGLRTQRKRDHAGRDRSRRARRRASARRR